MSNGEKSLTEFIQLITLRFEADEAHLKALQKLGDSKLGDTELGTLGEGKSWL